MIARNNGYDFNNPLSGYIMTYIYVYPNNDIHNKQQFNFGQLIPTICDCATLTQKDDI